MTYYVAKIAMTSLMIVVISEIAKRSTLIGAILASIPLISVFAIFWLYIESKDVSKVSAFASSVFWLVLPSLVLFVTLPLLLKQGIDFYLSMAMSIGLTGVCYYLLILVLGHFGINL